VSLVIFKTASKQILCYGRFLIATMLPLLVVVTLFVLAGLVQYDSWSAWLTKLQGYEIEFDSLSKVASSDVSSEVVTVDFRARNVSSGVIKLMGAETSCSCVSSQGNFPVELLPSESVELTFAVHLEKVRDAGAEVRIVSNGNSPVQTLRITAVPGDLHK